MDRLAQTWREAGKVVVLTGAGLSTASGIPDFRSPGGRWERYQPTPIQEFLASEAARIAYWRYKEETWKVISQARPNAAHIALADLGRARRISLLVTQNVDGLHRSSGFPRERLIRIHGTDAEITCLDCDDRRPRESVPPAGEEEVAAPRCACGGYLKPATISFGQSLVEADLDRAFQEAGSCDLMVAAGTSLVVGPINNMIPVAHQAGARIAILTASSTPFDGIVDFSISRRVEESLPLLRDLILDRSRNDPRRPLPEDRPGG